MCLAAPSWPQTRDQSSLFAKHLSNCHRKATRRLGTLLLSSCIVSRPPLPPRGMVREVYLQTGVTLSKCYPRGLVG